MLALIMKVEVIIALEEEGECLVESIVTLKSCGYLITHCLSSVLFNLVDLEHGQKGSDSAHE